MQKSNKLGRIFGLIIILAVVVAALYFYANRGGADINAPAASNSGALAAGDGTDTLNGDATGLTVSPSLSVTAKPPVTTVAPTAIASTDKNLLFFMDKDRDQQMQTNEAACSDCRTLQVLVGSQDNETAPINNASTMVIDSYSKITQNRVQNFNVVWGLLANKNLLIPPTRFAFGDGSGDVQIPVWQITGVLAGVNANISSATDEDGSIVYNFSTLVPTLQTAYNNQDTVWFKFTPDTTKDSIYYLSGAKLTLTDIGYQAKVDWTVAGGAANLIKVDNLQLIILQPLAK